MERSSIFLIEPVPGIKGQELDLGSLGQIGRFVNDESPGLHSSLVATSNLAPQLAGLFRELPSVMRAARRGLPAATRALRAARPLVDVLYPAGRNLEPFFKRMTGRPAVARAFQREGIPPFGQS